MSRNSSGVYSLYTPGNPVVPGTVIASTWANNTLTDIATALTDSLSRNGDGAMLAPLRLTNGVIGAPALSFSTETTSGLYRAAAGDFRYSVGGVDILGVTNAGISVTGTFTPSGAIRAADGTVSLPGIAFSSDTDSGIYRIGANNVGIAVNGAKVLDVATTGLSVTGALAATGAVSGASAAITGAVTAASEVLGSATGGNQGTGTINATALYDDGVQITNQTGANPSASIGLSAVNGSAGTFMRSDAAPALSQSIAPTWTGAHTFSQAEGSVRLTVAGPYTGQGWVAVFRDTTNSVNRGYIGIGTDAVTGAAATDFVISPGLSGSVAIGTSNGGSIGTRFGPTGNITTAGVVLGPAGAVGAPTYSFSGDSDTGMYSGGTNNLNFATGGGRILNMDTNGVYFNDGSASLPTVSFFNDANTGLYSAGADSLGITTGGTKRVTVGPGVQVGAPTGGDQGAGTINATNLYINGTAVGYLNIPLTTLSGSTPTAVLADSGKGWYGSSGSNTVTIPANASVAYPVGTVLSFANDSATAMTIAITSDTLVLAGSGATGSRTLAQYGVATAMKVTSTRWIISGTNLT